MTVNVALVGLGYWGPNLARAFASISGARLHTLCDMNPERLRALSHEHAGARGVAEFKAVLADPEVHAVALSTPVHTHFDLAAAALRAGKHVLVEKPLARSGAECRELIRLASERKLTLMAGHVFLYNPAVLKVKTLIESGELGELYYVYSQRLNLGILRQDVNALWNFAPHDISILNYWLGSAPLGVVVRGFSYIQKGIEDVVFMTLDYPKSIGANVHISWLDPRKVRTMTVVGSKKMVVYDDVSSDARITIYDKGVTRVPPPGQPASSPLGGHEDYSQFRLLLRGGDVLIPKVDFTEPLKNECRHFVECVETGRTPLTDGFEALRVVEALEAADRSLKRNGAREEIPAAMP
jgi:predicted dehydrogenase